MILQLNPPLPLESPKGKATAYAIIDYGMEHFLLFVCFIDETGEQWTFRNDQIRMQGNQTMRPTKPQKDG